MSRPGNSVGIRNQLPSDRESWHRGAMGEFSDAGYAEMRRRIGQIGIGRFLLSKKDSKKDSADLDNSVVDIRTGLVGMNRNRGVGIELGKIMMMYQTPEQFFDRVQERASSRGIAKHLTPKGQKLHLIEMKEKVAGSLRRQSIAEAERIDERMRAEDLQLRQAEMAERQEAGYLDGLSYEEIQEEFDDVIIDIDEIEANLNSGSSKSGFKFRSKFYFEGDQVGLKVRYSDDESGAELTHDIDRINEAYHEHGLIVGQHRELIPEDLSLFVPLFVTSSPEAAESLYLPYVTKLSVPFQGLGIHKIQ